MRFSIVIPTRNRSETLFSTLQTCLAQVFTDYEIVVSDNCSSDRTREVVEGFASPKIRYFRSETPLSMSDSWEFAVSKAVGEYVTVVGDDDGLLLHALRDLDLIIRESNVKVVRWNRVYYNWPNIPFEAVANQISIPLTWDSVFLDTSQMLKNADFQGDYTRLPMFYNSVIHRDLIDEVRCKAGRVFLSVIPDVASGVAFAYLTKAYPSIGRPMSINAGSGKSNGLNAMFIKDSPYTHEFNALNDRSQLGWHPILPKILTISASLVDAYLQVSERLVGLDRRNVVDRKKLIVNCLNENRWRFNDDQVKQNMVEAIRESVRDNQELSNWFEGYILENKNLAWIPLEYVKRKGIADGMMYLDGNEFAVSNVYEVALLYEKITGHLDDPFKFASVSGVEQRDFLRSFSRMPSWMKWTIKGIVKWTKKLLFIR